MNFKANKKPLFQSKRPELHNRMQAVQLQYQVEFWDRKTAVFETIEKWQESVEEKYLKDPSQPY